MVRAIKGGLRAGHRRDTGCAADCHPPTQPPAATHSPMQSLRRHSPTPSCCSSKRVAHQRVASTSPRCSIPPTRSPSAPGSPRLAASTSQTRMMADCQRACAGDAGLSTLSALPPAVLLRLGSGAFEECSLSDRRYRSSHSTAYRSTWVESSLVACTPPEGGSAADSSWERGGGEGCKRAAIQTVESCRRC